MALLASVTAEVIGVERHKSFPPGSKSKRFKVTIGQDRVALTLLVDDSRPYVPGETVVVHVLNEDPAL